MMTDAARAIVWEIENRPFGDGATVTGTATLNLRFPGQYYYSESGLNYNYFRDYNPAVGRYVEADPIGLAGGVNPFVYVQNEPINWFDLDGLNRSSGSGGRGRGGREDVEFLRDPLAEAQAEILRQEILKLDPTWAEIRPYGARDNWAEVRFLRSQLNNLRNKNDGCEHFKQRRGEARAGDTHRQIGDHNRTIREGREFIDTETGNNIYVRGNKVVVTDPTGKPVSQFKNSRSDTVQRILKGKWVPK